MGNRMGRNGEVVRWLVGTKELGHQLYSTIVFDWHAKSEKWLERLE